MNPELRQVSNHIRDLAQGALAHACWHANYHSLENPFWNELSVIQAAHAMELFVKARIAEEHPLLIFKKLPGQTVAEGDLLNLRQLSESGQTYAYNELPDRLWASSGIRIRNLDRYRAFGKLRNLIQHFSVPADTACGRESIDFIYNVIDPFINECWGYFAVDYNEDHEPYEYLVEGLIRRQIEFLVSPGSKEFVLESKEWPNDDYKRTMIERAQKA